VSGRHSAIRFERASKLMPEYVAIGHICADLQPDGTTRLGGTALFAGLTAHQLGVRAAILTACAPDLNLSELPPELTVIREPSATTTRFENLYHATGRTQLLHARAKTIDLKYLPPSWRTAPIIHFAPVIQEVPIDDAMLFSQSLLGLTPQGWLRAVLPNKQVVTDPATLLRLPLTQSYIIVLSEEDIQGDEALVRRLAERVPLVVLTRAERGATVFMHGRASDVPAFQADIVDPTGAGDVFAAAFFIGLYQGREPLAAARWACAAAACSIEGPGISTLPTTVQVERRMREGAMLQK
jgi:hypothetical protein